MPVSLAFVPENAEALCAELPAASAVFALRGASGSEPYVGRTANLRRKLARLLGAEEITSKRLNLRATTQEIEYSLTGSDFESRFALYRLTRELFPRDYRERLNLRFAALIRLNLDNDYPRALITRKIGTLRGKSVYYGPFASRLAAEKFLNDSLDFFKMRRCDFELNPDPSYPGCVYSEMKMCLAPCFKSCSDEQYAHEVQRVRAYFDSGGQTLRRQIEEERAAESEKMNFEGAALLHEKLAKLLPVLQRLEDFVRPIDKLNGVIVQRAPEGERAVKLFRLTSGMIFEPVVFPIELASGAKSQSMESRLAEAIAAVAARPPASANEWMENIALLRRWVYRGSRKGELFLEDRGELPLRRLVRGVSRVFKNEKESEAQFLA